MPSTAHLPSDVAEHFQSFLPLPTHFPEQNFPAYPTYIQWEA